MKDIEGDINYKKLFFKSFCVILFLWILPYILGTYVDITFPFVSEEDIAQELAKINSNKGNNLCPLLSPRLRGLDVSFIENIDKDDLNISNLATSLNVYRGGIWKPLNCQPRYEVSVIVPYRDRPMQLNFFLAHMHPFLQRQQIYYRIIVVEQMDANPFNRGRLFNIGFDMASKLGIPNECLIFHDVDLIPEHDYNIYACTRHPRHMYSAVNVFRYHLPYRSLCGGVMGVTVSQFVAVNGFANSYFGWGGEDDDFCGRLINKGFHIQRFDPKVARYFMIPHQHATMAEDRSERLKLSVKLQDKDGLNSLRYEVVETTLQPLFTLIRAR